MAAGPEQRDLYASICKPRRRAVVEVYIVAPPNILERAPARPRVAENDRDIARLQLVDHLVGLDAAADGDPQTVVVRNPNGRANLIVSVGVEDRQRTLLEHR